MRLRDRPFAGALLIIVHGLLAAVLLSGPAEAVEAGQPAPAFKLPSTTGADIALADFKNRKWVFLEFYGADFAPT